MTKKDEDGHRTRITLRIDRDTYIVWLDGGAGQREARDEVATACYLWLRRYAHGLLKGELLDITWNAMEDTYIMTKAKALSVDDSLLFLQNSLNAKRIAEKRRHQRYDSLSELAQEPQDKKALNFEEEIVRRDFWRQMARLIERHMVTAFISLSERDQDIIAIRYGIEEIGDPTRQHVYPDFPSPEAEKKAVSRARARFSKHLEALLTADLDTVNKLDRPLYEAALAVVRGGKVLVPAGLTGDH
jgi:hypothetical protein